MIVRLVKSRDETRQFFPFTVFIFIAWNIFYCRKKKLACFNRFFRNPSKKLFDNFVRYLSINQFFEVYRNFLFFIVILKNYIFFLTFYFYSLNHDREFSLLGLLLIAIGSGGIKPCVAAFGGDQFVLPQQERHLITFFSVFYFAINSGSLVSSFLTPELRYGVKCFGERECYSLAFFVPAVLMVASIGNCLIHVLLKFMR